MHGGHETAPWHYLGGHRAAARYQRKQGHPPKNRFGESLFAITVVGGLRWARQCREAELVEAVPRYHPRWAYGVLKVPGVREFATWNLATGDAAPMSERSERTVDADRRPERSEGRGS